jgi:hypothetical protein
MGRDLKNRWFLLGQKSSIKPHSHWSLIEHRDIEDLRQAIIEYKKVYPNFVYKVLYGNWDEVSIMWQAANKHG